MPYANLEKRRLYHKNYNASWYIKSKERTNCVCKFCKIGFRSRNKQTYCSQACFSKDRRGNSTCRTCNKIFYAPPSKKRIYCSRTCVMADENQQKRLVKLYKYVKDRSFQSKRLSELRGELNPAWKGSSVGYKGLHLWINTNYPKKNMCEHCNKSAKTDRANISGKYLRDISDWLELCRPCHGKYDKKKRPYL